jgi:hypothetical protein
MLLVPHAHLVMEATVATVEAVTTTVEAVTTTVEAVTTTVEAVTTTVEAVTTTVTVVVTPVRATSRVRHSKQPLRPSWPTRLVTWVLAVPRSPRATVVDVVVHDHVVVSF